MKEKFGWYPKEQEHVEVRHNPDPSCHACGGPIILGEPVAIYHLNCDPDRANEIDIESLLWMLKEHVQNWREAAKGGNRPYLGKWVYEDCAQEIEDLVKEYEGG